jgi:hypothetical protein
MKLTNESNWRIIMRVKRVFVLAFIAFFSVSAFAQEAEEEEEKDWSVTLDLPFYSKYVWRGINLVDNWVFQPSIEGNYKWVTLSVWSSTELTNENTAGDFTEIDYITDLSFKFHKIGLSAGSNVYTFPNTDSNTAPTTEIYAGVSLDVIAQPSLTTYYDVDLVHGFYVNLQVGHSFEDLWKPTKSVAFSVDLGAGTGICDQKHSEYYYEADTDGWVFSDALFRVGIPIKIGDYLTVTPSAFYSVLLDNAIRSAMTKDENFWWGSAVTFSF